jgi:hypothetical protein
MLGSRAGIADRIRSVTDLVAVAMKKKKFWSIARLQVRAKNLDKLCLHCTQMSLIRLSETVPHCGWQCYIVSRQKFADLFC